MNHNTAIGRSLRVQGRVQIYGFLFRIFKVSRIFAFDKWNHKNLDNFEQRIHDQSSRIIGIEPLTYPKIEVTQNNK